MTASPDRQDTIRRAITLIDATNPADMTRVLRAKTVIRASLADNPAKLRDTLANAIGTDRQTGAWKGAQQILDAFGLPT